MVTVSKMRAQDVCNKLLPGLGYVIAILVAIGGLAFNVGNVGGVALGFNAMFGLDQTIGAVVAGCLGIIIFINKNAKTIMDKVATLLAAIILITVLVVAVISQPPLGEVAKGVTRVDYLLNPENNAFTALTTLLGGSCGGYIAFSGASPSPAPTGCWTPASPALRTWATCARASSRAAAPPALSVSCCSWRCWAPA